MAQDQNTPDALIVVGIATIKSWFVKGAVPKAAQFASVFDSFWHKNTKIPMSSINGLSEALGRKAETQLVEETAQAQQQLLEEQVAKSAKFLKDVRLFDDLINADYSAGVADVNPDLEINTGSMHYNFPFLYFGVGENQAVKVEIYHTPE
ncbi:hypothetical protein EIB75_10570 [Epilithonimonas vandammei]|uniref:Uncharacterized protein n=1 Tax=Epilithonimonas vandammei TaxID=2487072 RepID=A0A3G8ZNZ0_9FLAO|nr:hypothetical protein [Epilithonimonas vandammei]AZI53914.1 hypothetical protein EIB75_00970 [Epilithonimonas vandammei]AZI55666.1 hypothetical protein EIB75_10570 [Epilithonimonas vandammei]